MAIFDACNVPTMSKTCTETPNGATWASRRHQAPTRAVETGVANISQDLPPMAGLMSIGAPTRNPKDLHAAEACGARIHLQHIERLGVESCFSQELTSMRGFLPIGWQ